MAPVNAHLMFVDGRTIKARVPDPPPETFTVTSAKSQRVLLLRRRSANGAIYMERDRRKISLPVEHERRRTSNDS